MTLPRLFRENRKKPKTLRNSNIQNVRAPNMFEHNFQSLMYTLAKIRQFISIEENKGYLSRVTFAYDIAPSFLRKSQKTEKMTKHKTCFKIFISKKASKFQKVVISGILLSFAIDWLSCFLILVASEQNKNFLIKIYIFCHN